MTSACRAKLWELIESIEENVMRYDISIPAAIGRGRWEELGEKLAEARRALVQEPAT